MCTVTGKTLVLVIKQYSSFGGFLQPIKVKATLINTDANFEPLLLFADEASKVVF